MRDGDKSYDQTQWLEEMVDDGFYKVVCPAGHNNTVVLQVDKFEVLFELALNAIVDGYYRDAVASFTASLERFYEFYVNVGCDIQGVSAPVFEAAWDSVSRQSERQLGAFVFTYVLLHGKPPALMSNRDVEFRNEVTHKGRIPTKERAIEYGRRVFTMIVGLLDELKVKHSGPVLKVSSERANKGAGKDTAQTILLPHTTIGTNRPRNPDMTLDKGLENLRRGREIQRKSRTEVSKGS